MRTYDIYNTQEQFQVTLIVHDDGRKEWDWSQTAWQVELWYDDDVTPALERALDDHPQAELLAYSSYRIRRRSAV